MNRFWTNTTLFVMLLAMLMVLWMYHPAGAVEHEMPTPTETNEIRGTLSDGTKYVRYVQPVELHPDQPILRCKENIPYHYAAVLAILETSDALLHVYIDTNKDGVKDIEAVFFADNTETIYPDIYVVDYNYDGIPDLTFSDEGHTGECDNIVPVLQAESEL